MTQSRIELPVPGVRPWQWGVLGLLLAVAAIARIHKIDHESFWADEFLTAQISAGHGYQHFDLPRGQILPPTPDYYSPKNAGSWLDLWKSLDRSTHPPLYFLLLRAWQEVLQTDSDAGLRSLSTLFSLITIALAFDAVRHLQRSTALALWSAALLAVANTQVQFGQEARGYELLCTGMMGSAAALARIERLGVNRWRMISLCFGTFVMLMTHYLGFGLTALFALYVLTWDGGRRNRALLCLSVALVLMLMVWGPSLLVQRHTMHARLAWMIEPRAGHWAVIRDRLELLPLRFITKPSIRPGLIQYFPMIFYLLPILALRWHRDWLLWTMLFIGEMIIVTVGDVYRSTSALAYPRYTLPAATAATMLYVLLVSSVGGTWFRRLAPGLLVLASLCTLPLSYDRDKPDWRKYAAEVDRFCANDSVRVFFPNGQGDWYAGLLQIGLSRYGKDNHHPVMMLHDPATEAQLQMLPADAVIDVISGSLPADKVLPGAIVIRQIYFPMIGAVTRVRLPNRAASQPTSVP